MRPPASRARRSARSAGMPSATSAAATASAPRYAKSTRWQRERIVGSSWSAPDVTRMITARGGGSSSVLSSLLAAASLSRSRSASNSITTLRSPSIGLRDTSSTTACASSMRIWVAGGSISTTSGCTPRSTRSHERSSVSVVIKAAAKQRAASSTPLPRGPDEQIGVHRAAGGALQLHHRTVLPGDPGPVIGCHHVRHPASNGATASRTTLGDLCRRHRRRRPRSTRATARGRGTRRAPMRGTRSPPARAGRVSSRTTSTVRSAHGVGDRVGHVEQHHDVGREAAGRDRAELLDHVDAEAAHDALVHERRRHVAVAHHPVAARQRGLDLGGDVLRAVGRHQQRLGDRRDAARDRGAARRAAPRRPRLRRARTSRPRRGPGCAATSASRAACVLFPLPSPPSSTTNRPRVQPVSARSSHGLPRPRVTARLPLRAFVGRRLVVGLVVGSARDRGCDGRRLDQTERDELERPLLGHRRLAGCGRDPFGLADGVPREEPGDERDDPAAPQRDAHAGQRVRVRTDRHRLVAAEDAPASPSPRSRPTTARW